MIKQIIEQLPKGSLEFHIKPLDEKRMKGLFYHLILKQDVIITFVDIAHITRGSYKEMVIKAPIIYEKILDSSLKNDDIQKAKNKEEVTYAYDLTLDEARFHRELEKMINIMKNYESMYPYKQDKTA